MFPHVFSLIPASIGLHVKVVSKRVVIPAKAGITALQGGTYGKNMSSSIATTNHLFDLLAIFNRKRGKISDSDFFGRLEISASLATPRLPLNF